MKLLKHQSECIDHLREWKVGALFMEAGTGKTRAAMILVNETDCSNIFWIGPLRTLDNVKDEVTKWGGWKMDAHYYGVESISSSDRVWLELREKVESSEKPFVVVDESLKIKNSTAKRTKRIIELGKMVEYKLVLNGTPMSKDMMDIWPQMEFLSPKILGMTEQQFKNIFCKYTTVTKRIGNKGYSKEYITGYENIDYLHSLVRHYVYHCDLSLNIGQNYSEFRYELDEDSLEEYKEIKERFLDDEVLQWKNNNIFLEMTQKMQHVYCCDSGKFEIVDKLFEEIPEDGAIIFCKYIDSRVECERRYPKAKVLSYQKEAFGLNMQKYHHTIYFDKIWDLALRVQSGRRTFRTGQEYDCQYYDLTGNVGLEKMIDSNIQKKVGITEYFKKVNIEELRKEL